MASCIFRQIWRMRQSFLLLGIIVLTGCPARTAVAQVQADLRWVEVEAAVSPNGKTMVQYKVHWKVNRGTMGGFYFQGEQGRIDWHRPGCGAVVNGQRRFDLDLRDPGKSLGRAARPRPALWPR